MVQYGSRSSLRVARAQVEQRIQTKTESWAKDTGYGSGSVRSQESSPFIAPFKLGLFWTPLQTYITQQAKYEKRLRRCSMSEFLVPRGCFEMRTRVMPSRRMCAVAGRAARFIRCLWDLHCLRGASTGPRELISRYGVARERTVRGDPPGTTPPEAYYWAIENRVIKKQSTPVRCTSECCTCTTMPVAPWRSDASDQDRSPNLSARTTVVHECCPRGPVRHRHRVSIKYQQAPGSLLHFHTGWSQPRCHEGRKLTLDTFFTTITLDLLSVV